MKKPRDEGYDRPGLGGTTLITDIYVYEPLADMESQRIIPLLAEDGGPYCWADIMYTFAINANSAHKEGAWEFLSYMMSEEVQRTQSSPMTATNRAVCMEALEEEIRWLEKGNVMEKYVVKENTVEFRGWTRKDITEEKVAEFISMRDRAEPKDTKEFWRMKPIWQIIQEEAEAYFTGDRSIEEVADIITKRVQLYLDENR